MELKMKNANIMRVHKKNNIYGELSKKGGLRQFAGGLVRNRVFLRGGG